MLCVYAFDEQEQRAESVLIALKCLANLLLLNGRTRQYFVDEGYATAATKGSRVSTVTALVRVASEHYQRPVLITNCYALGFCSF